MSKKDKAVVLATENEETTAAPTVKAATLKTAAKAAEPVVYLGPTIERVIAHGTVIEGEIPAMLQARIESQPFINGLIFPISQYAIKAAEVGKKGSALYNIAKAVTTN